LDSFDVTYQLRKVDEDSKAMEELLHYTFGIEVPTLVVGDGEDIAVGWHKPSWWRWLDHWPRNAPNRPNKGFHDGGV
jgi:hypothetical protein